MRQRNEYDFTALIGSLLSDGWFWVHDPPSEDDLAHWLRLGRAECVMVKKRRTTRGLVSHYGSLLRAKRESAPLQYDRRVTYAGEWSAWETVDDPREIPWTFRDIERWI